MKNRPIPSRSGRPPVLSVVALAVPIICGAVLLRLEYQISAFLPGLISLILAVLSMLLCLAGLLIRERPPWIAGVAFMANGLLLYSLTFINLH